MVAYKYVSSLFHIDRVCFQNKLDVLINSCNMTWKVIKLFRFLDSTDFIFGVKCKIMGGSCTYPELTIEALEKDVRYAQS